VEKIHCTTPKTILQTDRTAVIEAPDRGIITAVRIYRVGVHGSAVEVKIKLYNHPQAPPTSALPVSSGDSLATIAAAAPELFVVTPELVIAADDPYKVFLGQYLPYTNRRKGVLGAAGELYLSFDAAVADRQWLVSLDVSEGSL